MTPPIHFASFGTLPEYLRAMKRIKEQAEASGYFATVKLYIPQNTPGLDAHAAFIQANRRGYGYWIWKTLVLLDRMRTVPEGDIVVYADAGCNINSGPAAAALFHEWIAAVLAHPRQRIGFHTGNVETMWCKGDLLAYFGGPPSDPGQLWAGAQIMVNTATNRAFVAEWLDLITRDGYHFVTDAPSRLPNEPEFREHRHDQSVFSLLAKQLGYCKIPQPGITTQYPIAVTRQRYS